MPAAIPVIASFAAAGSAIATAGGFAAAAGTLAGFAAISGAVLTGVGALTGKKDLMKVGSLLSLGGSAVSAFSAGTQAAGQAAGASSAFGGVDAVGQAVQAAGGPTLGAGSSAFLGGEVAANAGPFAGMSAGGSALEPLRAASAAGDMAGAVGREMAFEAGSGLLSQHMPAQVALDPLQASASSMSMQEMNAVLANRAKNASTSLMDRMGGAVGKTADFIKKNKELVEIGGKALSGAFGPEAELADLKRDEWDYRRSLLDRQRRNLNSPIRLAMGG